MFGTIIFGINPFATVSGRGIVIGLVWANQCPSVDAWTAQGESVDPWAVAAVANTSWTDQRESEIITKECR